MQKSMFYLLKRLLIFARENLTAKNSITFDISKHKINVKALADKGKAKDKIDCIQEGEDVKISLNAQFINDYLSMIDNKNVFISFKGKSSPVMIQTDSIYITMPFAMAE